MYGMNNIKFTKYYLGDQIRVGHTGNLWGNLRERNRRPRHRLEDNI
jgi:hypothetical protein